MCIEKCLPQSKDTINGDNYFQMPLNSLKTNVTGEKAWQKVGVAS